MSYYKTIDGKQMDSRLLDIALQAVEGAGDGRISQHDAEKLFEAVKDGNVYTPTEKNTIAYIREHFKWTESADHWFRSQISHWRSPSGTLSMSPAEIADIVSDRLMAMISAQFESTKIQFATSNNSHAD